MLSAIDKDVRCHTPVPSEEGESQSTRKHPQRYMLLQRTPQGHKQLMSTVHDKSTLDTLRPVAAEAMLVMRNYAATKNDAERKDVHAFHADLYHVWENVLGDYLHMYDIARDAVECSDECLLHKTVVAIDARSELYGCWAHGYVHHCTCEWSKCAVRHVSEDLSVTCALSGRPLGFLQGDDTTYRGRGQSCSTRKAQFDYYQSLERANKARNTGINERTSTKGWIDALTTTTAPATAAEQKADDRRSSASELSAHPTIVEMLREADAETAAEAAMKKRKRVEEVEVAPPSTAAAAAETSGSEGGSVIRMTTKEELTARAERERQEKARTRMQRAELLHSSSQIQELAKQAKKVAYVKVRAVIVDVIEEMLYDVENRQLYNRFMRGCTVYKAHEAVRVAYQAACKERMLLCHADYIAILDHYNRSYIECIPQCTRDERQTERYVRRIMWLWEQCHRSPFVRTQLRTDEATGVYNVSPFADDMCSLQQFALACLYRMRDGYSVNVPGTAGDMQLILPSERSLILELPDEAHVRYFGVDEKRELQRHLRTSNYIENDFDPTRAVSADTARIERAKTRRRTRASSAQSVALVRSKSIESSLINMKRDRKRRRETRSSIRYKEIGASERTVSLQSGRVTVGTANSGVASVTEYQLTKFYHREPLLTGGGDRKNILRGNKFMDVALASYEHAVVNLPPMKQ